MATAGVQKTAAEIIPVVADFSAALETGDSIISGNVVVSIANLISGADATTDMKDGAVTVSGALVSIKVKNGSSGIYVVQFSTGLTSYSRTYTMDVNVEVTTTPRASNLLADIDEFKRELGIASTDTSEDTRLFDLLVAASDYLVSRCQRDFVYQTYTETIRPNEENSTLKLLRLRNWPVYTVTAITLRLVGSPTNYDTALTSTQWAFRKDGWVWLLDEGWMTFPNENIVTYKAGFPILPADIRRAAMAISVWFYRLAGREGLASERIGDYAYTKARLTSFPGNMKFELPDEFIEGVISRYSRRDISDQD